MAALTMSMSAVCIAAPVKATGVTARKAVAVAGTPVRSKAVVLSTASRASRLVVRAADEKKEGEAKADDAFTGLKPTKAADFKAMSNEDLIKEVVAAKKMLFELRMRQSTRKEYKGHHFGILKTKIAQIRTVKREREVTEGVNKRDSRKIKREERAANMYL